jgi:RNA polymerase sigma factor (sigma-70 family)
MITREVYEILKKEDWEAITYKLTLHVRWLMDVSKKGAKSDVLDGGLQVDDIVQDAITKLFTGEREWNPETDPNLVYYLKYSVIKSLVNNYFRTIKAKNIVPASKLESNLPDEDEPSDFWETVNGGSATPEEEVYAREIISAIRVNLNGDDDAGIIFEEVIKGSKPGEISADLGVPIEDVRNAIKRIRSTKAREFKSGAKS